MRTVAQDYKAFSLIAPVNVGAGTTTGTGVAITPNEEQDAMAIVHLGTITGSPTSSTVVVTIAGSATVGGTYTTLATISNSPSSTVSSAQIATAQVNVNTASYAFIRAVAVVTFTGGTGPSLTYGVSLLQRQLVGSSSNVGALA